MAGRIAMPAREARSRDYRANSQTEARPSIAMPAREARSRDARYLTGEDHKRPNRNARSRGQISRPMCFGLVRRMNRHRNARSRGQISRPSRHVAATWSASITSQCPLERPDLETVSPCGCHVVGVDHIAMPAREAKSRDVHRDDLRRAVPLTIAMPAREAKDLETSALRCAPVLLETKAARANGCITMPAREARSCVDHKLASPVTRRSGK